MSPKIKRILGNKKGYILATSVLVLFVGVLSSHEVAVRYFPDITCVACHEMREPVRRWRESGVAKNHPNCADCHFDAGISRIWEMNREAIILLKAHFTRDPQEPIRPPQEPMILDLDQQPGYYSLVPNHRCFQCKDAKNHKPLEQQMVHRRMVRNIADQPCKDCHNHEMRKGQKFYEPVLIDEEKSKSSQNS